MLGKILIVTCLIAVGQAASAHHSHSRDVVGFATSTCVSFGCYSRHSSGTWRHPLTAPTGRSHRARGYSYPG